MRARVKSSLVWFAVMCGHIALGDVAVAQWVQTNGPSGGDVRQLAVSGTDLFAGSYNSGIFRTTNNGALWRLASAGLPGTDIQALAASETTQFVGFYSRGVYRSTDKGATWNAANQGMSFFLNDIPPVTALGVFGATVFVGFDNGAIYRSTDDGRNWKIVSITGAPSGSTSFVGPFAAQGSTIYVCKYAQGLMKSIDAGATWTSLRPAMLDTQVVVVAATATTVFAGDLVHGISRSTDGGLTWTRSNAGLTDTTIQGLCVQGSDVFVGTRRKGVFISTNDGASWNRVSNGLSDTTVTDLVSIDKTLFAVTDAGVCRSTDKGATWSEENHGLANGRGSLLFVSDTTIMTLGNNGLNVSHDNGDSWSQRKIEIVEPFSGVSTFFKNGGDFLVGTSKGGVYRSTDFGRSWSRTTASMGASVTSFAKLDDVLFASTYGDGVYRSTTNGDEWIRLNNSLPDGTVLGLVVSGNYMFAYLNSSGVYYTANAGTSWELVGTVSDFPNASTSVTEKYLFTGTSNGMYRSADLGMNWQKCNDGLTDLDVSPAGKLGPYLYTISRSRRVFLSKNDGTSWTELDMTGVQRPGNLTFNNTYMFASNGGLGLWRRPLAEVFTSVDDAPEQAAAFRLRVHPNPSRGNAEVSFSLLHAEFVTLNIYNMQGERTATLLSNSLEAGTHTIEWNTEGSEGGLHFVKLQTGTTVSTAHLLIFR